MNNDQLPDIAIQFNEWPNTKGIGSINAYAEEEYFNDNDVVIYTPKATAQQRIEELEVEIDSLEEKLHDTRCDLGTQLLGNDLLKSKLAIAVDALNKYGRHSGLPDVHCDLLKHSQYNCTCGFDNLLKQLTS